MTRIYLKDHWEKFISISPEPQGVTGDSPVKWAEKYKLDSVPEGLSDRALCRDEVRKICQEHSNVLFGYICAMAWGGQGSWLGGAKHVTNAWSSENGNRLKLEKHLEVLRKGNLSRLDAYNLFTGEGKISGLGPAFWTKLLFFFGPDNPLNSCYIMDKWTAKSVNLLTGLQVAKMSGDNVSSDNKGGNYQAFCEEIDRMAETFKEERGEDVSGAKVEEWLFSQGGRKRWPWRAYVYSQCNYDPELLHKQPRYAHISKENFGK